MKKEHCTQIIHTPVGALVLQFCEGVLTGIQPARTMKAKSEVTHSTEAQELQEYFRGVRQKFSRDHTQPGTTFQQAVWREASRIPYGKTVTYGELAKRIGKPKAVRAVGTALGANPVPIIVPCHRVVPASGGVGNYAFGSKMKAELLRAEGATY